MPLVRRTRAILRRAEFGFFGVTVATRVQTPRRCGAATDFLLPCPDLRPGVVVFFFGRLRPFLTSCCLFGTAAHSRAVRPRPAPPPPRARRRSRFQAPPWRRKSALPGRFH